MRILIAGGGTGGHLFPGIALAEEFIRRDCQNTCIFVGTMEGIESRVVQREGFDLKTIDVKGVKGKSIKEKVGNLFLIPKSLYQSFALIKDNRPNLVIGTGGYASAPVVFVAFLMRIKTAICEQNSFPGITNRILARFVDRIFISYPQTVYLSSMKKARFTGNPIRKSLIESVLKKKVQKEKFTLLVLGGSQGAHSVNEKMIEALIYLAPYKESLRIIHQTGDTDHQRVSQIYTEKGMDSKIVQFIDDMAQAYQAANLVICRAGATTLSEITLFGKASILIPFSFAANNHQEKNARVLLNKEAAKMILERDLNGKNLADLIIALASDQDTILNMEKAALKLGKPKAAKEIVDICYEILDIKDIQKNPGSAG
ncbi:MAG: undecaprenyldiphospho-muramoylpentapeptide beta-N-acetylglucosaminyltransferase [Thermodesulfobacteriota bacterium]|nr:undecaprenyldiphospho-muramoylpentapeptide beta-N-acetylglucosaminyltransferase [Thermodesulfobacteriota bacterium]